MRSRTQYNAQSGAEGLIAHTGQVGPLRPTQHDWVLLNGVPKFVNTCLIKMKNPVLGGSASDQPGAAGRDVM